MLARFGRRGAAREAHLARPGLPWAEVEVSAGLLSDEAIDAFAQRVGRAWLDAWAEELRAQHRPMSGGWPGTLSEARARTAAQAKNDLGPMRALDAPTLEALARKTYEVARAGWLSKAARDPEP